MRPGDLGDDPVLQQDLDEDVTLVRRTVRDHFRVRCRVGPGGTDGDLPSSLSLAPYPVQIVNPLPGLRHVGGLLTGQRGGDQHRAFPAGVNPAAVSSCARSGESCPYTFHSTCSARSVKAFCWLRTTAAVSVPGTRGRARRCRACRSAGVRPARRPRRRPRPDATREPAPAAPRASPTIHPCP